jgi:hypothetical protein
MFYGIKARYFAGVGILGMLLTFQNCTSPLNASSDQTLATFDSTLPFAYKAAIDTVAYMSCSNVPKGAGGYFTFWAGALNNNNQSGLGLTTAFLQATPYLNATQRALALSQSSANNGAYLQLAVRDLANYQTPYSGNGSSLVYGEDLNVFLSELDVNQLSSQLGAMTSGQWKSNFNLPGNVSFTSTLNFTESETLASNLRSHFSNPPSQAALAITFTPTADPTQRSARGPSGSIATSVYGTAFKMAFGIPQFAGWSGSTDSRVLQRISEFDMVAQSTAFAHGWSCPIELMIVQPQDVVGTATGTITCNEYSSDPSPPSPQLALIRSVIGPNWYVDLDHSCIVPMPNISGQTATGTACYGDRSNLAAIDYSSGNCTAFNPSTKALGNCPHWVSICSRQ